MKTFPLHLFLAIMISILQLILPKQISDMDSC